MSMHTSISIQDKKEFIQWFLNHYRLKKRESIWILNYLINQHQLLANVHFVREVKFCPRGIMISAHCSKEVSFRFYKKQLVTTDADKAFHDIRINRHEDFYIQLNFDKANQNPYYAGVLEENPFTTDEYYITEKDQKIANRLLNKSLFDYKRKILKKGIDHALDKKDQSRFTLLVNELHRLEVNNSNQPKKLKQ